MRFVDDFLEFLQNYGVMGLAVAFVIGQAAKDLVTATVNDLIMPVVGVFLPGGAWREATLTVMSVEFRIGHFLSVLLDFVIIAALVFLFARHVMKKKDLEKI